jgi:DNA polymerase III epsilon subunit-like protein
MAYNTSYTRGHPGKYGLCIDWETSGSTFGGDSSKEWQGLSFGAVVFDTDTFEPVETMYRELHFDDKKYKWSDEAAAIHGLTREHLKEHGVTREQALCDLLEMILKYWGPDQKIMLAGHNVGFDADFTNQLCEDFGMHLVFHHVMLDTSAAAFILIGKYRSNDVFDLLGNVVRTTHNALEDALITLSCMKTMKLIFSQALK